MKRSIVNETLLQNCSVDKDKWSSTEEDKPECKIMKKKDTKNEVTYGVTNYFNAFTIFGCERNLLDRLDVSYEIAFMVIQ